MARTTATLDDYPCTAAFLVVRRSTAWVARQVGGSRRRWLAASPAPRAARPLGSRGSPLGALTANSTPRQVAATIIHEAHRRGYSKYQATAILADALQESYLNPHVQSLNRLWYIIFQQGSSYPGGRNPNLAVASSSTASTVTAGRRRRTSGSRSSGCSSAPGSRRRRPPSRTAGRIICARYRARCRARRRCTATSWPASDVGCHPRWRSSRLRDVKMAGPP
jgi:hypothetical protein